MRRDRVAAEFGREAAILAVTVLAAAILSLASPDFLTLANLANIGVQSSMGLIVAVGMTVVIISGGIDLSVGSLASLVGMTSVWLLVSTELPAGLCLAIGLCVGPVIGILHGGLVVALRIPGIIVTLGSMTALRGLASLFANGAAIQSPNPVLAEIAWGRVAGLPVPIVVVAIVAVGAHLFLSHSAPGRALYAVGGNPTAARVAGIKVGRAVILAYAISGLTAAIAGLIAASRTAAGSPIVGLGWELKAVAVAILGGAHLFGGSGRILGTVLAGVLVAVIENGMSLLSVSSWVEGCLVGGLLVAVVAMDALRAPDAVGWRQNPSPGPSGSTP
jgi:ribose transport system permease protein